MKNKLFSNEREREQQAFEPTVPQYFVNSKGALEESPIRKNMQELIDSAEFTCLDELYDRMLILPNDRVASNESTEAVFEREGFEEDLELMLKVDAIRDAYAKENPDVAFYNHSQMLQYINSKISASNAKIDKLVNEKEVKVDAQNANVEEKE